MHANKLIVVFILFLVVGVAALTISSALGRTVTCPACGMHIDKDEMTECPCCGQRVCIYCADEYAELERLDDSGALDEYCAWKGYALYRVDDPDALHSEMEGLNGTKN